MKRNIHLSLLNLSLSMILSLFVFPVFAQLEPSSGKANYTVIAAYDNGTTSTPYIAYSDEDQGNKATVRKLKSDGTGWETVGTVGFSAGAVKDISIAFDNTGIPYVVYSDASKSDKAVIMKYNGTAWEAVGDAAGISTGAASYTSIALCSSNVPHVVYSDAGNGGKAVVMKFNGTAWEAVGTATGISAGSTAYTSIAIYDCAPYVAYKDIQNGGKAAVIKWDGTIWSVVGPGAVADSGPPAVVESRLSTGEANYISMAINSAGIPYVAYQNMDSTTPVGKLTVVKLKNDGTGWDAVGARGGFTGAEVSYVSLALNVGVPYVTMRDPNNEYKASVTYYDSGWKKRTPAKISDNSTIYTALAFSGNTPYVIYRDDVSGKAIVKRHNGLTGGTAAWEAVPTAPLPVTLVDFTAKLQNTGAVKLQWQTSSESNNKEFIISRSVDGQDFKEIKRVAGSGNSTIQKDYISYDTNPINGINYYRLQQLDLNGKITDWGIKSVTVSLNGNMVKVYPNPVGDYLNVEFATGLYHQLELIDVNGKVLQKIRLGKLDAQTTLNLHNEVPGVYFVKLIGKKVVVKRIVKE